MEIIELVGMFVARLMMLVMYPVLGLLSLVFLNSFSWLYIGIIGLSFAVQIKIPRDTRIIATTALSLGIIMMWVSLFISFQELPNDHSDFRKPVAVGGFPITAFEYPPGALGSDVPPINTWKLFYLNLSFWIIIGSAVSIILRKYSSRQVSFKLFAISMLVSLCGLGYLTLKFD